MRSSASQRVRLIASTALFCLVAEFFMCGPPVGGILGFKSSSRRHPRKFGQKRFLAMRRSRRGNGVACFWATSVEKIIGGVLAIVSYRPGGWMQQSAVPRCAILSVGSTEGTCSEQAITHRAAGRRGGGVATRGVRPSIDQAPMHHLSGRKPALTYRLLR